MKIRSIVLLLLIAGVIGVIISQSMDSLSQYTDFETAKTSGKEVHVVGKWVQRDQHSYDPNKDLFQFYMQDSTGITQQVHYRDPKPVNFESAEKVVVIGQYEEDVFMANKILMKCPSKYETGELKEASARPVSNTAP